MNSVADISIYCGSVKRIAGLNDTRRNSNLLWVGQYNTYFNLLCQVRWFRFTGTMTSWMPKLKKITVTHYDKQSKLKLLQGLDHSKLDRPRPLRPPQAGEILKVFQPVLHRKSISKVHSGTCFQHKREAQIPKNFRLRRADLGSWECRRSKFIPTR